MTANIAVRRAKPRPYPRTLEEMRELLLFFGYTWSACCFLTALVVLEWWWLL